LPIGVQVVARNWRDYAALAAASWIEKQLGGWQPASLGA
jgi:Asp-tRNA(Asn)/Glu-tRNA(Gln) amidotransferase A subunit family amidase